MSEDLAPAIAEALKMIEERPALEPKPGERPYLGRVKKEG